MKNLAEETEAHVLLVTLDAQGHMNPMLCLAKRLLSHGLNVTLATTETAKRKLLSAAAEYISGIDLAFFSDGLPSGHNRNNDLDAYVDSLSEHGPANLSILIRDHYVTRTKPSCIVTNNFVPWAADVAAEFGIKIALLWIQPCILYALYYRIYNHLDSFEENDPDMTVELPGLPLLKRGDLPSFVLASNEFRSIAKLIADVLQNIEKYEWVLGNSFNELEREIIESMTGLCEITPIGPLIPTSLLEGGEKEDEEDGGLNQNSVPSREKECMQWLNQQSTNSVVYVSFGSVVVLSAKQIENMARGLNNSHCRFLWVAKPADYPHPKGNGQVPIWFAEETRHKGIVVPWCPQTAVLAHPAVACFVTHCGWNSLLEAIAAGVPMIAFPQWTDQPTNAKLVVDVLRVGVRLRAGSDGVVESGEVARCVEEVMCGARANEYRDRAAKLKTAARDAVKEGGSTNHNIRMLVERIKGLTACST